MSLRVGSSPLRLCALALIATACAASQAQAQDQRQPDAPQPAQQPGQEPQAQPPQQDAQPQNEQGRQSDDMGVQQRDYMADERRPAPPQPPRGTNAQDELQVSRGAGVGSPLSYARRTVVELGGTLALTHESETTDFRIAPSIGYFFIDGLELTLFPELHVIDVDGNSDFRIAGTLEPSYHIALSGSELFGFAGIGIGLSYADDPGVDLFFRPRLGLDVMVGRSGILKPAVFLDVGANDGLTAGGLEAGFTVMW